MAARKVTTVTEENVPEDAEYTTVIDDSDELIDEQESLDALDGMIAEFSGAADTVVNVYRQGEGKNLSFLFRTSPAEMTGGEIMERCRDNFGTGDYRVHIRKGRRLVKNAPFSVEAMTVKETPGQQAPAMGIAEIIAIMQSSNDRMSLMFTESMRAMAEAFKGREQPSFDPVAMQTSLIQSLAALKGMTDKPETNQKDPVEMLVQGITLARELGPKDGDTNTSDILLEALKQFAPAIAGATHAMQARQPGTPANPALAGPRDPAAAADAQREHDMNLRNIWMKQQLGFLVKQAENGKDPSLYAEVLLDQLGPVVVLDFIQKDDALAQLAKINPGVAGQRIWFEKLRDAILELTRDDPTGETEVTGDFIPANGQGNYSAISDADDARHAASDSGRSGGDAPDA